MVGTSPEGFSTLPTGFTSFAGRQKESSCLYVIICAYRRSSALGIDDISKSHAQHAIKTELRGGQISPPPLPCPYCEAGDYPLERMIDACCMVPRSRNGLPFMRNGSSTRLRAFGWNASPLLKPILKTKHALQDGSHRDRMHLGPFRARARYGAAGDIGIWHQVGPFPWWQACS